MNRTLDDEVKFTTEWWVRVANDESKLIPWLQKLYRTEVGGYEDYMRFLKRFNIDIRTNKIFTNIAFDELKHGNLIEQLLKARGHSLAENPPQSSYWQEMDSNIIDLPTAAAVNYFGEALAAFRFEVIIDHPATPSDIKQMLGIILPDEQFHRTTLKKIAGDEIIERFQVIHDTALANLKAGK